ncbi:MAG TPA: transketolase [Lentimicrobium sp.]|nr:transketolase [Lentimicrobium sp.]
MYDIANLENLATQVRRDILRMVHSAQSGHPGGALGCTEFMVALYFVIMKNNPEHFTMEGKGEDLFFLSNGHLSALWYSVLARRGFFPVNELATFRKIDSRLQGHPATAEGLPGIRVASGSLGQGLSVAIGAAMAKRLDVDKTLVYSLHGDGELDEGQIWEAAMFAAAHKIDNLIATVDYNGQQIDGPTEKVMPLGNLKAKWESFGWEVIEMAGNDMQSVINGLQLAKQKCYKAKPVMIIMQTDMGHGVDFMKGKYHWHGIAPNDEQLLKALEQLPVTIADY